VIPKIFSKFGISHFLFFRIIFEIVRRFPPAGDAPLLFYYHIITRNPIAGYEFTKIVSKKFISK